MFEIGKCYEHENGKQMKVIGKADSFKHGECLVGEFLNEQLFMPLFTDKEWREIPNWEKTPKSK